MQLCMPDIINSLYSFFIFPLFKICRTLVEINKVYADGIDEILCQQVIIRNIFGMLAIRTVVPFIMQ